MTDTTKKPTDPEVAATFLAENGISVSDYLKHHRGIAQRKIADAVRSAIAEYHEVTGGYVETVSVGLAAHYVWGEIDGTMVTDVTITCL